MREMLVRPAGRRRDPPAGERRARLPEGARRTQQQRAHASGLGGELQPAAGTQAELACLGEPGGDAGVAQDLLERPKPLLLPPGAHDDQTLAGKPELGEPRREQVVSRADPDHGAASREPAQYGGRETGRSGLLRLAGELVQTAARETAIGKGAIDPGQTERHDPRLLVGPLAALEPGDLGAQVLEERLALGLTGP